MHVSSLEAGNTDSEIPISVIERTISPCVFKPTLFPCQVVCFLMSALRSVFSSPVFTPRFPCCVPRASLLYTLFSFCIFFLYFYSQICPLPASSGFVASCCQLFWLLSVTCILDLEPALSCVWVSTLTAAIDHRSTRGQSARPSTHNVLQRSRKHEGDVLWY